MSRLRLHLVHNRRPLWFRLTPRAAYKVQNLARICGISVRQLERMFQEDFGRAPKAWMVEQRMIAARHLLMESGSVNMTAKALGYSDSSAFSRDFRNAYGLTPTEFYRLMIRYHPAYLYFAKL